VTSDKDAGPTLLAIDAAGSACSAAVGCGTHVLAAEREAMRYGHGEALLPMIDRVMAVAALPRAALDGIAVTVGPGGFTGIRVGLGAAHGIALALGIRLIGVTSFAAVAALLPTSPGITLVALDSRRDDLYVQLFDRSAAEPLADPAAVLPGILAEYVAGLAGAGPLTVAGDAAESAAAALSGQLSGQLPGQLNLEIAAGSAPDAPGVLAAALCQIERDRFDRPVRPLYLRPPDVTVPKRSLPISAVRR
jgi:tRNA threonylcarbamoyladenosine biosynthesis protein TsaB